MRGTSASDGCGWVVWACPRSHYNRLGRTAGDTPQGCTAMRHDGRRDSSYGKHGRRHGQKQQKWAIISRTDSGTSDTQQAEGGTTAVRGGMGKGPRAAADGRRAARAQR